MNHKPDVRLVESHSQGDRRHKSLDFIADKRIFQADSFLAVEVRIVCLGAYPVFFQPLGYPPRIRHGKTVNHTAALEPRNILRKPCHALGLIREHNILKRQAFS